MIGFQDLIIRQDVKVTKLAKELEINPGRIWDWIKNNKIPEKYLKRLSERFNVKEDYLNKMVNDVSTYKPKVRGFGNDYKIDGEITYIYIVNRKLKKFIVIIDTDDLQKLIDLNCGWHVIYDKATNEYYARAIQIIYDEGNNRIVNTIWMQRFLMGVTSKKLVVDHHNHNRLDNRKDNLYITEHTNNSTNRKGANKNNKTTGIRNVTYIEKENAYWVQFMRKGERFRWVFPVNQFDEACDFAEKKRKELFGEYAGKG